MSEQNDNAVQDVYLKDENLFYKDKSSGLFNLWFKANNFKVVQEPTFGYEWKGSKMPFALWEKVVGFLRWSQKAHSSETMLIFFYHAERKEWGVACFPQETAGMTVKLLHESAGYATERALFGRGWVQFGSIHHHCNCEAFQSGTDASDEKKKTGPHITLGKMNEIALESHIRVSYKEAMFASRLSDWIETNPVFAQLPKVIQTEAAYEALLLNTIGVEPSDTWKARVEKRTYPASTFVAGSASGGFGDTTTTVQGIYGDRMFPPVAVTYAQIETVRAYMKEKGVKYKELCLDQDLTHEIHLRQNGVPSAVLDMILNEFIDESIDKHIEDDIAFRI